MKLTRKRNRRKSENRNHWNQALPSWVFRWWLNSQPQSSTSWYWYKLRTVIKREYGGWKGGQHRGLRVPKKWGGIPSLTQLLLSPTLFHLCSVESVVGDLAKSSGILEFKPQCIDSVSFFILFFLSEFRKIHVSLEGEIQYGCPSLQMTKACCLEKEKLPANHNEDTERWKLECSRSNL